MPYLIFKSQIHRLSVFYYLSIFFMKNLILSKSNCRQLAVLKSMRLILQMRKFKQLAGKRNYSCSCGYSSIFLFNFWLIVMQQYLNLGGKSAVEAYEILPSL